MEFIILLIIPLFFGIINDDTWQVTFCNIALVDSLDILHCDKLQDTITFESGNNINIELNETSDKIKISSTSSPGPNEKYCLVGEWFNAFNETTNNFDCYPVPGGSTYENNTASNIGIGYGLFKQKTGVNLEFFNIFCAGDLICSINATDFRISFTASTVSSSLDDLLDVIISSPVINSILYYDGSNWIDKIFKINTFNTTCSGTDKVSRVAINNQTGLQTITCSTDETGGTSPTNGYLVAHWTLSSTKTNIGDSFVDIYTQTNSNGKGIFIHTGSETTVRIHVEWTKVGTGTQTVQLIAIDDSTVLISLNVVSGSNDSGFVAIPAGNLNESHNYKLQAKSTTANDDPIFESTAIWLN